MRTHRVILIFLFLASACTGQRLHASEAGLSITRDQATQLLDTLRDPDKRERFASTLEAYIKALPPEGPPLASSANQSGSVEPAEPQTGKLLSQPFSRVEALTTQLAENLSSVADLPASTLWLDRQLEDSAERTEFTQACVKITLVLASTVGIDALLRWFTRRRFAPPQRINSADSEPRVHGALIRLSISLLVFLGTASAGNLAVLFVSNAPVARTIAFGLVNIYVSVPFLLALLEEFVRAEAPSPSSGTPARILRPTLRFLVGASLVFLAIQLLGRDVTADVNAPVDVQEALTKSVALVVHLLTIMIVMSTRRGVSDWIRRRARAGTLWASVTNVIAAIWPAVAICAIAGSWLVWALSVKDAYQEVLRVVGATVGLLLLSRYAGNLALSSLDRRIAGFSDGAAGALISRLVGYRSLARWLLKMLLIAVTLVALTEVWGLPALTWLGEGHAGHRLAAFALQSLVLIVVGIVCWEAADLELERRVDSLMESASLSRATRLRTLQPIIRMAVLILIVLLVLMTALNSTGINIGPLLAGAGIFGVALGFGSQKLVQDFITGIFLLVEDAMDVGDWVTVAGVSGTVEHLSIRTIRLRATDGSVNLVPFSSVISVNNTNRGVGNAAVIVDVDPSEDTDRVSALLSEIALQMRKEPLYAGSMQSDLQLWGIDKIDGSMVTLTGQIVCTDAGRWTVQREFNRRMKLRFAQAGVKLAIPQQKVQIVPDSQSGVPTPPAHAPDRAAY